MTLPGLLSAIFSVRQLFQLLSMVYQNSKTDQSFTDKLNGSVDDIADADHCGTADNP